MTGTAHALARDEVIRALTAYSGVATADGAVGGDTIVDSNLIGKNDFISKKAVLIMSGPAALEDKGAASFNNVTGTITLQSGYSAQITAGTVYRVLNISSVEIDVLDILTRIGTNTDAPGTTTLFAWLAKLYEHGGQGLVYYGSVTQVDDATHFRVSGLIGFGDAYFANTYRVYVVRDAGGGGAVPQGEQQPCTGYTSSTGRFTHAAFTAGLAVGDEVLLLHERIAEIADIVAALVVIAGYVDELETRLTAARATYLDRIKNLTRPQAGTQATTNVLTTVGAAIVGTVPFKVSGLLSLHNMQAGDTFLVVEEIRDQDDATYREYARTTYANVQTSPMVHFEEKTCQGWRVRIQRTGGADRDVTYQFFTEVNSA